MHAPGVVYLMKCSELGLAAWCLGSWWCVLWIRNKFPLSNMPSSTRYNGSTGFGRYSPLGGAGAGEGVQEVHLICRLGSCRAVQRTRRRTAEASWRSHASGSGDGGGIGGDISWGAGYGGDGLRRQAVAVERLGERRRLRTWSGPARGRSVLGGGARCAAWPVVKSRGAIFRRFWGDLPIFYLLP
jgi:hypothetical protein